MESIFTSSPAWRPSASAPSSISSTQSFWWKASTESRPGSATRTWPEVSASTQRVTIEPLSRDHLNVGMNVESAGWLPSWISTR